MNKNLLTAVSVIALSTAMFSTNAFANNTSTVTQSGNGNDAYVTQNLGQDGDSDVLQEGNNSLVDVDQLNSTAGHGNRSIVKQFSDVDNGTVVVNQDGNDNYSAAFQQGTVTNSRIDVDQDGNRNSSTGVSEVVGGITYRFHQLNTTDSKIKVKQDGNDNIANNGQNSTTTSDITVKQLGSNAISIAGQLATWGDSDIFVTQYGTVINSSVAAQVNGSDLYINVTQNAGGNTSSVSQIDGNNLRATVIQNSNNSSTILQEGNGYVGGGNNNLGPMTSYVEQQGDGNTSDIIQWNSNDLSATVRQGGDDNKSTINQGIYSDSGLTAKVTQSGDKNESLITQNTGSDLYANVKQTTNSNMSMVYQTGANNSAWVTQ